MPATLKFIAGGTTYDFSASGIPQWEQRSDYESQGDATAQIRRTTYTVNQTFTEQSYADNEAQIHLLRAALDAGEGMLVIDDENGVNLVTAPVRVKSDSVPRAWRQYVAEVSVVFDAREALQTAGSLPAVFTPTGGSPVQLANVTDWKVKISVQRNSNQVANRDEAIETITATGFILADKTQTPADRITFLQQQLQLLRACNARDGALTWGGDSKTVRVASLDGDLGDGKDRLNWTLAAFYKSFPQGSYAQPEYTVTRRNDYPAGELVTSVRGKVKADDKPQADAAVAALLASYATAERELSSSEVADNHVDGVDGAAWIELSFSFEYREPLPETISYELRISTREDARTSDKTVSYEGKVTGTSAAAALAAARGLGLGKLPFILSSQETVSTRKNSVSGERFVEVAFNYEYLSKSVWQFAEITRETTVSPFGEPRITVGGYASAATIAEAQALAESFQIEGLLLRDSRQNIAERVMVNAPVGEAEPVSTRQPARVDFTWTYYSTPTTVSLAYGKQITNDFSTLEKTIVYSGVARGPNEASCLSVIAAVSVYAGAQRVFNERKTDIEKQESETAGSYGTGAHMISVSFTDRFLAAADSEPGIDILAAQYSVKKSYSINKTSFTLIPQGLAYLQEGVGTTPGACTVSGSVTARNAATAQTWGKAKQSLLPSGGKIDVIEDDLQTAFLPLSGTVQSKHTYNFTFTARYQQLTFA